MLQIFQTLSHSQAAKECQFSVNKEVFMSNLKEVNMTAIHLIHDSIVAKHTKISVFVIIKDWLTSFNHASNKYKMHLLDKSKEDERLGKGKVYKKN